MAFGGGELKEAEWMRHYARPPPILDTTAIQAQRQAMHDGLKAHGQRCQAPSWRVLVASKTSLCTLLVCDRSQSDHVVRRTSDDKVTEIFPSTLGGI